MRTANLKSFYVYLEAEIILKLIWPDKLRNKVTTIAKILQDMSTQLRRNREHLIASSQSINTMIV